MKSRPHNRLNHSRTLASVHLHRVQVRAARHRHHVFCPHVHKNTHPGHARGHLSENLPSLRRADIARTFLVKHDTESTGAGLGALPGGSRIRDPANLQIVPRFKHAQHPPTLIL